MKKIKDVIQITGLSRRTLQYYDDHGLVKAKRSKDNYRLYGKEELWRLWKILVYKEIGFQLDEIADLLDQDDEVVKQALEKRIGFIDKEIQELEQQKRFAKKVLDYGMPDQIFVERIAKTTNYKDMVSYLAQKEMRK